MSPAFRSVAGILFLRIQAMGLSHGSPPRSLPWQLALWPSHEPSPGLHGPPPIVPAINRESFSRFGDLPAVYGPLHRDLVPGHVQPVPMPIFYTTKVTLLDRVMAEPFMHGLIRLTKPNSHCESDKSIEPSPPQERHENAYGQIGCDTFEEGSNGYRRKKTERH